MRPGLCLKASDLEEKIRSRREAARLQAGEMLFTMATDVGWTPYFGLLALDGKPLARREEMKRIFGWMLVGLFFVVPPVNAEQVEEDIDAEVIEAQEKPARIDRFNSWSRGVNFWIIDHVLEPTARGYNFIIPKFAQTGVGNVTDNLDGPRDLVQSLLQGKFRRAGRHGAAFLTNSTVGLGGIFVILDPDSPETGNETLGHYGAGTGHYLVVPFVPETAPRQIGGDFTDIFLDPVYWAGNAIDGAAGVGVTIGIRIIGGLNDLASFMPSPFASESEWDAYREFLKERHSYEEAKQLYYDNQKLDVED